MSINPMTRPASVAVRSDRAFAAVSWRARVGLRSDDVAERPDGVPGKELEQMVSFTSVEWPRRVVEGLAPLPNLQEHAPNLLPVLMAFMKVRWMWTVSRVRAAVPSSGNGAGCAGAALLRCVGMLGMGLLLTAMVGCRPGTAPQSGPAVAASVLPVLSAQAPVSTGSAATPVRGSGMTAMRVLGKADSGKELTVRIGDQLTVELAESPTTGYGWSVTVIDGGLSLVSSEFHAAESGAQVVGQGGLRRVVVKATAAVQAGRLQLVYMRPWEGAASAVDQFALTLRVEP
jgi:inhibitor of cysteine peptidase